MRRGIGKLTVAGLVCCMCVCLFAAKAAEIPKGVPGEDVLFYASYNEGEAADTAKGRPEPAAGGGKSQAAAGRVGSAREFARDVHYSAADNISWTGGTIALWILPKWDPQDKKHHPLVDWIGKDFRYNRLLLYKYSSNTIYFGLRSEKKAGRRAEVAAVAPIKGWKTGEWHHLVGTWESKTGKIRLYLDGRPAAKSDTPWECGEMAANFKAGCKGTVMDELLILKRPLSAEEAQALYRGSAPNLAPNARFEEATPDGRACKRWAGGSLVRPGRNGVACLRIGGKGGSGPSAAAGFRG